MSAPAPRAAAAVILAALLAGCAPSGTNTAPVVAPTPSTTHDPAYDSATDEWLTQDREDPDNRVEARRAAERFVASAYPGWKAEGVSTLAYTGNLYLVAVDLSQEKKRQTISLVARMFINAEGEAYWKVDPMTPEMGQALSGWTYQQYRKLKAENRRLEERGGESEGEESDGDPYAREPRSDRGN
ncbi:MAG TPA: hypothetical protein VF538_09545 [Pyrinomonadaceae bacterium]|jgi:hypothetical protein